MTILEKLALIKRKQAEIDRLRAEIGKEQQCILDAEQKNEE